MRRKVCFNATSSITNHIRSNLGLTSRLHCEKPLEFDWVFFWFRCIKLTRDSVQRICLCRSHRWRVKRDDECSNRTLTICLTILIHTLLQTDEVRKGVTMPQTEVLNYRRAGQEVKSSWQWRGRTCLTSNYFQFLKSGRKECDPFLCMFLNIDETESVSFIFHYTRSLPIYRYLPLL